MTAIARNRIPETSRAWAPAALACMGIVFGDIGTSPLYAFKRRRKGRESRRTTSRRQAVLGIVSLIFWSLIIVISIKYAILIMRADNHGEGGILALLALVSPRRARQNRRRAVMVVVGLVGATLLYGDGAITPAISVLSAIEGMKVYAPQMGHARRPADGGDPRRLVPHPAQRHLLDRRHIRAGHAGLVRRRRRRSALSELPGHPPFSPRSVLCRPSPISGMPGRWLSR